MKYKSFWIVDDGHNDGLFKLQVGGDKAKLNDMEGATRKVRVVSNTSLNNGVDGYIHNDEIGVKNCITIASRGNDYFSCYQDDYTVTIVRALLLHTTKFELNEYVALYICALLRMNAFKFDYGRVLSGDRLKSESILLPVDEKGLPVWKYIENLGKDYYDSVHKKVSQSAVHSKTQESILSSVNQWVSYRYDEVFKIVGGYFNKKPEESKNETDIPFIGASEYNNGITSYHTENEIKNSLRCGNADKKRSLDGKIFDANCITLANNGNSVGSAFYQDRRFTSSHDVTILYLLEQDQMNSYVALFICTLIRAEKYRWSYGRKWRPNRMNSSIIKLPSKQITEDGETKIVPDWKFMEDCVKLLPFSSSL